MIKYLFVMKKLTLIVCALILASTGISAQRSSYVATNSGHIVDSCIALYDQRFESAVHQASCLYPWQGDDKTRIRHIVRQSLGYRDEWIPEISASVCGKTENADYRVEHLSGTSWKDCYVSAHLYLPKGDNRPLPVVFLACGHGDGGKLYHTYHRMAEYMASSGLAVLVTDNIGQGERTAMGHYAAPRVFDCGLSVQGLIVMEAAGWLNWLRSQPRFDKNRIAVCGNSGGGTLGLFLSAVAPEKSSVLVSSGYPSSFLYVARKEKPHCHCNIIPGIVGQVEMWQVLGCFAPKPMYILQGKSDEYFPADVFVQTSRKVGHAYQQQQAAQHFKADVYEGTHGWDEDRIQGITNYVCQQFGTTQKSWPAFAANPPQTASACYKQWPHDAIDISQLAERLTGKSSHVTYLREVYPPACNLDQTQPSERQLAFGDARDIFAQFEAFLYIYNSNTPTALP